MCVCGPTIDAIHFQCLADSDIRAHITRLRDETQITNLIISSNSIKSKIHTDRIDSLTQAPPRPRTNYILPKIGHSSNNKEIPCSHSILATVYCLQKWQTQLSIRPTIAHTHTPLPLLLNRGSDTCLKTYIEAYYGLWHLKNFSSHKPSVTTHKNYAALEDLMYCQQRTIQHSYMHTKIPRYVRMERTNHI